jgi:hypothetical protein
MNGRWMAVLGFFPLFLGCASLETQPLEVKEARYGKNTPVINEYFASKEMRPGGTWMVYLKASDPDGDMANILCTIDQPGMGIYPRSITRIKKEDRKELSGYIYLPMENSGNVLNLVTLTLRVQIQDQAGHYSAPVSFPLSLNDRYAQESPPKEKFQDKDLGPIMIRVRTIGDGNGAMTN